MRIHHMNCGSMNPRLPPAGAIVYCLLVETNKGMALIDTGFGRGDYQEPSLRMRLFLWYMGVPRLLEETARQQIISLGRQPEDVRDIVLTYLHLDHAGGLPDFPKARVHVHARELAAAKRPRRPVDFAYDPRHWSHNPQWHVHEGAGQDWFGLHAIRIGEGLEPEILMIPLPGHTRGHCGVAVRTGAGWLLHCGDAASAFHSASDLHANDASRYVARILPKGFVSRFLGPHVPRLRRLVAENGEEIQVISGHDLYSFARHTHQRPDEVIRGAIRT